MNPLSNNLELETLISRVADQFMEDLAAGKAPSIEGFAQAYPEIGDLIRQVFPALMVLQDFPPSDSLAADLTGSGPRFSDAETGHSSARELGDFRILREIGRGGMGVVYEAEQLSLGRRVALKVLPFAAMLDQQQLTRFKNEARAAATLDHPHIVSIYSVGSERGIHYYAMQLVEGGSLAQLLSIPAETESPQLPCPPDAQPGDPAADTRAQHSPLSGTLPDFSSASYYQAIAQLGIQAAQALDHAHSAGILHRDIKPANLLIDSSGKLMVADFGLARIESDATLTATGDLVGTLRYMSPEQLQGDRAVVDHRSDIYSLGATLYELATREPLYKGTDRARLMADIERGEPMGPRKINRRIPVDLETIILKAIEREPVKRYATAKGLAEDLQRFLESQPIKARPVSLVQRASKWSRRHRTATLVTSVAAVMLLMFASALMADRWRQVREGSQYVEQSIAAAWSALEQNDVPQAVQRLGEAATRIDANKLAKSKLTTRVAELEQETVRYRQFMKLADVARFGRSESIETIARASHAIELYDVMTSPDWLADLERLDLPQSHVERIKSAVYELLLGKADELTRWDASRTPETLNEAIKCLQKAVTFHPPSRGYYWLSSNCSFFRGDTEKGHELRSKALETPPDHAAELFYINRDRCWGTASPYWGYPMRPFVESYKDHREMLRFDPSYYNAMFFMAMRLEEAQRYEEALVAWNACASLRSEDWVVRINRANCHFELGHIDEGVADLECLLDRFKSAISQKSLALLLNRGARLLATASAEELRDGRRSLEFAQQACDVTDYQVAQYIDTLAAAHAENGNFAEAVKWARKAINLEPDEAARKEYEQHLKAFQHQQAWRRAPPPRVSAGMGIMVAQHLQESGELDASAIVFANSLKRIPLDTPRTEARGRHGEIDRLVVRSDEVFARVSKLLPSDPSLHFERLIYLASHRRWSDLPPVFRRLAEIDPGSHRPWHEGSAVAYHIGDMETYEAICRTQLERLKDSTEPYALERLAKSCCLTPHPPEVTLVQQLAERAIELGGDKVPLSWFGLTAALAHYRGKDYEAAIQRADEALDASGDPPCEAATLLVKAMSLYETGCTGEASELFARAGRLEAAARPQLNGQFDYYWADWLRFDILKREAEELFGTSP